MSIQCFNELLSAVRQKGNWQPPEKLLTIDPGETTGWAFFKYGELSTTGQIVIDKHNLADSIEPLMNDIQPTVVVLENYRVYPWKMKQHSWSNLFTPQLIGAIQYLCSQRKIPVYLQMANQAKTFCTDDKLKTWGFWRRGEKHARDAIRHGCYWLLFNREWS
jgi:hypothetical protein